MFHFSAHTFCLTFLTFLIMLTYNNIRIGKYNQIWKGEIYECEIRQGNVDGGVFIHLYKNNGETYAQLKGFIDGRKHINNMIKSECDLFENCENIQLNIADKGARIIMEYACKMGHDVTAYYSKI